MLYAHGPDLCRESDLRHAMANCFEALIGNFSFYNLVFYMSKMSDEHIKFTVETWDIVTCSQSM